MAETLLLSLLLVTDSTTTVLRLAPQTGFFRPLLLLWAFLLLICSWHHCFLRVTSPAFSKQARKDSWRENLSLGPWLQPGRRYRTTERELPAYRATFHFHANEGCLRTKHSIASFEQWQLSLLLGHQETCFALSVGGNCCSDPHRKPSEAAGLVHQPQAATAVVYLPQGIQRVFQVTGAGLSAVQLSV